METTVKNYELSLLDKLIFPSILKKEGSFEDMIIVKDIKKKINITQDEVKEYNLQSLNTGGIIFNEKGSEAKFEIEFTELETKMIKEGLKKLEEDKKLTEDHLDLYKKFIN